MSLTDQATRMVFELQAGNIRDNVALPVPMVDRGRWTLATSRSHHRQERKRPLAYIIATPHGILFLSNKYTRADFTLCPQQLLKDSDINRDKHVSLREALKCTTNVTVRPFRRNVAI